MTAITYTAQRELTPGHVADTEYTIELRSTERAPRKFVNQVQPSSLDFTTETLTFGRKRGWQITTAAFTAGERAAVREFLESVDGGESFEFDEFGTVNAEDNPVACKMIGVYRETRAIRQGDGGRDDYFRYQFTIREA